MSETRCGRCGRELPEGARFCDHCGARRTVSVQAVPDNPLDQHAVRDLLQRAEDLRRAGRLGEALDLVQEAGERASGHADWARYESAMRACIARTAVDSGTVGEPLPGTVYDPMRRVARLAVRPHAGPSIGGALLAFVVGDALVRIPSGALVPTADGAPVAGDLDQLLRRGVARGVELPDLVARHVLCSVLDGRVFVAGSRRDGLGDTLVVHDPDDGWREVIPSMESRITHLAASARGRRLSVGTERGKVVLVDVTAAGETVMGSRHLLPSAVALCGPLADGQGAFAWGGRGEPVLLGTVTGADELIRLGVPHHDVTDVALGAGGRVVITIDEVGQLSFFRSDTGRQVGQVHVPALQDPTLVVGGPDPTHEAAMVRPGGNVVHCYEFHYQVFVGEPVHVIRTKPEAVPDGGALAMDHFADRVVHADAARVAVYEARMRPRRGGGSTGGSEG